MTHERQRRTPRPLNVVVADPDPVARKAIVHALGRDRGIRVVGEAQDVPRVVELTEATSPDVAVVAEWFPGTLGGIDAVREIHRRAPDTRSVMLVLPDSDHDLVAGVRAGVRGYVVKRSDMLGLPAELKRAVTEDATPLSAELSEELLAEVQDMVIAGPQDLTSRESEVLALVRRGLSNRETAEALAISVSTVKTHVHALLRKLGCTRRVQLVMLLPQASNLASEARSRTKRDRALR